MAGQVADLAARVERLERLERLERVERLERLASRNSGSSSMPSADDLPGRTPPRRKQAGGAGERKQRKQGKQGKQGKQPGAPGAHRVWSENPGETVPHLPGRCGVCSRIAAHAIPVHRCAELIGALTGARPSPGFVHTMIARAAAAVAQANRAILALDHPGARDLRR